MKTTKFKKGQWIIAKWDDGDIDFAKFKEYYEFNDFLASQFYRFHEDGEIETLTSRVESCFLTDSEYKENWRLATKEEIANYIKLCGEKFKRSNLLSSSRPVRIQRSRKEKQVSPNGLPVVYVGRPTKFGNPFKRFEEVSGLSLLDKDDFLYYGEGRPILSNTEAVELFKKYCITEKFKRIIEKELKGKNLSCWCSKSQPCHADVLLKIANT